MKSKVADMIEVLQIFESDTARVLNSPDRLSREQGVSIAQNMPLDKVSVQVGHVTGKALADALEAAGMRPAEMTFSTDATAVLVRRLSRAITQGHTEDFLRGFREALGMRG
jgi:hypothetical protein